jgi:hypothetical protein
MNVKIAVIRAGIMGGDLIKAHPLTCGGKDCATIKATAEKVRFQIA